jgi:RimJ/RimL family protein N-acetyltransferase
VRHDYILEGAAFRLRPMLVSDAAFVVGLRTDAKLGRFLNATSARIEDQIAWLDRYFERPGDFYFVVEDKKTREPHGAVALYDEVTGAEAEWGRWILRPGSLAAPESALLIYRFAFGERGLQRAYCRTVGANETVISFHESAGLRLVGRIEDHFGPGQPSIEQEARRADWPSIEQTLRKSAEQSARLLARRAAR